MNYLVERLFSIELMRFTDRNCDVASVTEKVFINM